MLNVYGTTLAGNIQRSWELTYGGSWTSWQNMGGSGYVSIAVARLANGCGLQVAQRANGTVDTNYENPCATWSGWTAPFTTATTRYTYTTAGAVDTVTDPLGYVTNNDYDLLGRATSVNDPNRGVTTLTYDLNSNLLTTTDARGITLTTTYDDLNRPTALHHGATLLTQAVYDATGEKGLLDWSASYFDGGQYKTDITGYNDAYQPTAMSIIVPSNSHTSGLAGTYTYTTAYRADGGVVTETYPAVGGLPAEQVTYGYKATGEADSTIGQDLDGSGAPTGSPMPYVLSTTYDTLARVATRQLGDTSGSTRNVVRNYIYDPLGRLSALTALSRVGASGGTTIQNDVYAFDANNNIASRQDNVAAQVECFTYDPRNRLTRAYTQAAGACAGSLQNGIGPNPYERTYTFDGGSRMLTMALRTATTQSFTTRAYTYTATSPGGCASGTATNKPHAPLSISNYTTSNYAYDCTGNMTTRTSPAGAFTQTWDQQGRLTQVVKTAGSTSTYIYGPNGQRLIQEVGTTRTLYLPRQEVTSVDGATATVARYHGPGGLMVVARRTGSDSGRYYMGGDNQGSVSWMVNAANGVTTSTRYHPYGDVRGTPNQMPTDHGFVGQVEDDSTGLSYLNHRYYDSGAGSFISVDPLASDTGQPYVYGSLNPVSLRDASGLSPEDACRASGGGGACARATFDRLLAMPIPTGPKWAEPRVNFSNEMLQFDRDVAGYLGMFTQGNSFEMWGQLGVDEMDSAARLAYRHAGALWIGGALGLNDEGGLEPTGDLGYVYFGVRTYLDPSAASKAHREIETLFSAQEIDPDGDLLTLTGALAGVTFLVAGTACVVGAAGACPVAGGAGTVLLATSTLNFAETCFGGESSSRACGGAAFDLGMSALGFKKVSQGFTQAKVMFSLMAEVVGGGVSMGLADGESRPAFLLIVSDMAAG